MDQTIEPDTTDTTRLWSGDDNSHSDDKGSKPSSMGHQAYVVPDLEPNVGPSSSGSSGPPPVAGNMSSQPLHEANSRNTSSNKSQTGGIFTLTYYSWYFDVDTRDVARRCLLALNPFDQTRFVDTDDAESMGASGHGVGSAFATVAGNGTPDLYGPFWICTTVVFVLFFSSTLKGLLSSSLQGVRYEYQFDLLTGAAVLMYGYTFLIPVGFWLVIRYLNIAPDISALQIVCLYGYSNLIWIPVSLLTVTPLFFSSTVSNIIVWLFVGGGLAFSGAFIAKNLYRALIPSVDSETLAVDKRPASALMGGALLLHIGLAIAIKLLFFSAVKIQN